MIAKTVACQNRECLQSGQYSSPFIIISKNMIYLYQPKFTRGKFGKGVDTSLSSPVVHL